MVRLANKFGQGFDRLWEKGGRWEQNIQCNGRERVGGQTSGEVRPRTKKEPLMREMTCKGRDV